MAFGDSWESVLAVILTGVSEPWKKFIRSPSASVPLSQNAVNCYPISEGYFGVLRCCCDVCDRCLGGPDYLTEYCREPKQMPWMYGLHKDRLTGAKSVAGIFLFKVQRASCLCEIESQGNDQYKSLKELTGFWSDIPPGKSDMQWFALFQRPDRDWKLSGQTARVPKEVTRAGPASWCLGPAGTRRTGEVSVQVWSIVVTSCFSNGSLFSESQMLSS